MAYFEEVKDVSSKNINLFWAISLMAIGIATFIIAVTNIIGVQLPDIVIRLLGIIELIALPVLVFTTIKKVKNKE